MMPPAAVSPGPIGPESVQLMSAAKFEGVLMTRPKTQSLASVSSVSESSVSPGWKVSTSESAVSTVKPVPPSSQSMSKSAELLKPCANVKPASWNPPAVVTDTLAAFHPSPYESLARIWYGPGVALKLNVTVSSSKEFG